MFRHPSKSICGFPNLVAYSIMLYFSPFFTEKAPKTSIKRKRTDGNEQTKSVQGE